MNFKIPLGPLAGALLVIIAVCFYIFVYPWLYLWIGFNYLIPNPPKPEITYGEFPFRLIYELNGEAKVIEDTVICEFDGFESYGEAGKYRKWTSRLKSGNERVTLLKADSTMELYFSYGSPEFYMNDSQHGNAGDRFDYNPKIIDNVKWEDGREIHSAMLASEAWEKYKLKIIDWQYTPPIKNSFK